MHPTPKRQRHKALIQRLEAEARRAPAAYRMRVALLAGLGFAILGLAVLLALAPLLLIAYGILRSPSEVDPMAYVFLVAQVVFAALILRALWFRIAAPDGHRLLPDEAPTLWAEIERLRLEAGAPPLAGVVIDASLNAAAASCPRALGLLGEQHYLVLGLPLLRVLDREELAAVIAHEFGHFRGGHGRFSAWIYRLRRGWEGVDAALARMGHGLAWALLRPFFRWYFPYFDASSFVLAREDEYAADAAAARVVGGESLISALIRVEHAAHWLQRRYWTPMQARMRAQPQPPLSISAETARWLGEAPPIDASRVVAAAESDLAANDEAGDAHFEDTHPTLPQRIAAIGAPAALRARGDAALAMFADTAIAKIERMLDADWRKAIEPIWREQYAAAAADRAQFEAMERREPADAAEALRYAQWVEIFHPERDPIRAYERVLALAPEDPTALFRAGVRRVEAGEIDGVSLLRRAMQRDPGAIRASFALLDAWRRDGSLPNALADALETLRGEFRTQAASLRVREGVDEDDELIAHDLDPAGLAALEATLGGIAQVGRAWLVRKRLDLPGEMPHYTLLVTWRGSVVSEAAGLKRLTAGLSLPGSVTVFSDSDSARKALAQRVRAVCGEPVYRR